MEWLLILVLSGTYKGDIEMKSFNSQIDCMQVKQRAESMHRKISGRCMKIEKIK